jgi:uncharacterized iron-regulated membrane protein
MTDTKKAFLFVHRWLGFITGLTVFIVSITGCIYCFQDDIQDLLYDYRTVQVQQRPLLVPSVFQQAAKIKYPEGIVTSVIYYGRNRSLQVRLLIDKKVIALYFDPYTAKLLHAELLKGTFFALIKEVHLYLFLPKAIGKIINGVSVILFVVIMISGIVLWWPRRKVDRKRSLTIKWGAKWKRVNYDLHNVLGFYTAVILILMAITGLSFSFKWMTTGLYRAANLGKDYPIEKKLFKSDSTAVAVQQAAKDSLHSARLVDYSYRVIRQKSPQAEYLLLFLPAKAGSVLSGTAYPKALHFSYSDFYSFDQYSGELISFLPSISKSAGMRLNNMNYDIHTGQIAGFGGKLLAFCCSLVSASLPVTGLILYLGKHKRSKKKKVRR